MSDTDTTAVDQLCKVCNCFINPKNLASHNSGKQHLKREKQQQDLAAREANKRKRSEQVHTDTTSWLVQLVQFCKDFHQYDKFYGTIAKEIFKPNVITSIKDGSETSDKKRVFAVDCEMVLCEKVATDTKPHVDDDEEGPVAPDSIKRAADEGTSRDHANDTPTDGIATTSNPNDTPANERVHTTPTNGTANDQPTKAGGSGEQPTNSQAQPSGDEERLLARVSIVEWTWERQATLEEDLGAFVKGTSTVLLDEHVKIPSNYRVVDLLTHVSGVEQEHLDAATFDLAMVQDKLSGIIGGDDILVGHSLWSDFTALQTWHSGFIDTAFLFGIANLNNFTPSLKDVATYFLGLPENQEIASQLPGFQEKGFSHDSVQDAEWTIRVLSMLFKAEMAKFVTANAYESVVPYNLTMLPERFRVRLTVQRLPDGSNQDTVRNLFRDVVDDWDSVTVNPLRWIKSADNVTLGSCVLEFASAEAVKQAFEGLSSSPFTSNHPRFATGFPDRNRFLRKYTPVPGSDTDCEVISYIRLDAKEPLLVEEIAQKEVGKVMGKRGRRISMIQQCTGVLVKVHQPSKQRGKGKKQKVSVPARFEFWAATIAQAEEAKGMVHKAVGGDDLGIN